MQKRDEAHWQAVVGNFCRHAAKHILKGATFAELRARLTPLIDGILDCIGIPAEARTPGLREAMATMLGMDVWNVTPIPENRFRPRKLNKPERNAPCPCGSGHKFKQCCANLPPLDLGITEELMLSEVLGLLPQKTLKELPLHDLHRMPWRLSPSAGSMRVMPRRRSVCWNAISQISTSSTVVPNGQPIRC
jgi:hypothetical protein